VIPDDVLELLKRQPAAQGRADVLVVQRELAALGVDTGSEVAEFFESYRAVNIHSRHTSEQLMDPAFPSPQLAAATQFVQEVYQVDERFLCITSAEGEGFYLYDLRSGVVFDVAVAQLEDLESGKLTPRWSTFFDMLRWYLE
jgi:hypothetical protein